MNKFSRINPSAPILASSVAISFIAICLFVFVLHQGRAIIIPLVISVFVWYLINAIARAIGYLKIADKSLPRFIRFTLAILARCGILTGIGVLISRNIADVIEAAPHYQENFQPMIQRVVLLFGLEHEPTLAEVREYLDVGKIITFAVKILMFAGFVMAFIWLLLAGISYITSNGEPAKTAAAQKKITYAIIGLVVIILAFSILTLVENVFSLNAGSITSPELPF